MHAPWSIHRGDVVRVELRADDAGSYRVIGDQGSRTAVLAVGAEGALVRGAVLRPLVLSRLVGDTGLALPGAIGIQRFDLTVPKERFVEFEERIIARYTDFREAMGWRYVGLFDLEPIGEALGGDLAVVYAVDAPTAAAALELGERAGAPPSEIVAFGSECSSYKASAGDWIWLEPVIPSA